MADSIVEFGDHDSDFKSINETLAEVLKLLKQLTAPKAPTYPKKLQEFMDNPESFNAFLKENVETYETERKEFEKQIAELEGKVGNFEKIKKEELITKYLDFQEEKKLISKEARETMFKDFSENFTFEQVETMLTSISQIDFSKVEKTKTKKSKEIGEKGDKDFEKTKEELEQRITNFKEAGLTTALETEEAKLKKLIEDGSSK